jgi:hypothetical protein
LGARHRPFTTDRDIADTDGPASLGLTREQRVRDPIGSDLVIAVLICLAERDVVGGCPAPEWEDLLA